MTRSEEQEINNLRDAKKLCVKRLRYDHAVYPIDRYILRAECKRLARVILHIDIQMREIRLGQGVSNA
jgi:hypothetical protein